MFLYLFSLWQTSSKSYWWKCVVLLCWFALFSKLSNIHIQYCDIFWQQTSSIRIPQYLYIGSDFDSFLSIKLKWFTSKCPLGGVTISHLKMTPLTINLNLKSCIHTFFSRLLKFSYPLMHLSHIQTCRDFFSYLRILLNSI